MNLIELTEQIDSEEKARDFLEKMRWPDGVTCPRCDHEHISRSRTTTSSSALLANTSSASLVERSCTRLAFLSANGSLPST